MANSKYSGAPVKAVSAGIENKEIKKDKEIYSDEKIMLNLVMKKLKELLMILEEQQNFL